MRLILLTILSIPLVVIPNDPNSESKSWIELKDEFLQHYNSPYAYRYEYRDLLIEIGRTGDPEAIPFLEEIANWPKLAGQAVLAGHHAGPDEPPRYNIATARSFQGKAEVGLVLLGDEETFQRIVNDAQHFNAEVRWAAFQKLIAIGGERVIDPLVGLIGTQVVASGRVFEYEVVLALGKMVEDPPWIPPEHRSPDDPRRAGREYTDFGRDRWLEWKEEYLAKKSRETTPEAQEPSGSIDSEQDEPREHEGNRSEGDVDAVQKSHPLRLYLGGVALLGIIVVMVVRFLSRNKIKKTE